MADTFYEILGVPEDASEEEIHKAYRKAILSAHPDLHQDDPDAARRARELNAAFEVLSDVEARRKYDAKLRRQRARANRPQPDPNPPPPAPTPKPRSSPIARPAPKPRKAKKKTDWWQWAEDTRLVGVLAGAILIAVVFFWYGKQLSALVGLAFAETDATSPTPDVVEPESTPLAPTTTTPTIGQPSPRSANKMPTMSDIVKTKSGNAPPSFDDRTATIPSSTSSSSTRPSQGKANFAATESEVVVLNGHQYVRVDVELTWTEAQARAAAVGGQLATVQSSLENAFLARLIAAAGPGKLYFIDGDDQQSDGAWTLSDGTPMTWTNWDPGKPQPATASESRHVPVINGSGYWSALSADERRGYIIEWDPLESENKLRPTID